MAFVNAAKLLLQLAVLPVLARILDPSSFGLVALAMPFILVAGIMCDMGLGNAIVRQRETSPELESTIFWLSVLLAFALAAFVSAVAWPISRWLAEPNLPPFMMALSLILPLGGSLSVVNARIARERHFSLFAMGDILAGLLSSATAIGAAFTGLGAWSLVVQQFTIWLVKAAWLAPRSGFRLRFVCEPQLAWPFLKFGLHAAFSGVADLAAKSATPVIVGALLGVTALGHYSMAYQVVRVPDQVISGPLFLSIFTAVAQWGDNRTAAKPLVIRGLRGLVAALAPIFCGLSLVANLAVPILFGPKWQPTGPILAYLAPAGFFICLYTFVNATLMGMGRSDQQFRLTLLGGVSMTAGVFVGAHFGAESVAIGLTAGAAAVAPAYLLVLSRQMDISAALLLREIAAPLFATAVMALVVDAALTWVAGLAPAVQLVSVIAIGAISFAAVLAAVSWKSVADDLRWLISARSGAQPEPN